MKDINKIKPLCLSFWMPPIVRPQSILIGKMIPEWIKQGLKPVIITYDVGENWDIDVPIYKIPQYKINKIFSRLLPLRLLMRYWYFRKIYKVAKIVIQEHNCNIVFSFSNPQDSNILGAMLKKRLGIKFISHFSDPWHDNPYKSFTWLGARKVLKQEEFIAKHSNRVIFITEAAKQLVMKKFPSHKRKARVIPHCYDLRDYSQIEKNPSDKYIVSHIGAFYKQRNPELLFKALHGLVVKNPRLADKFKLQLVGCVNDYAGYNIESINRMIESCELKNNVEILPVVEYRESLILMKKSDCLIVIDADFPNSPFLPSKVIDYAGSGTTIIGITPANSPTAQSLSGLGYQSFNYNQLEELTDYLGKLINKEVKIEVNKDFLQQYDVRATTAKLINIFKEVLEN